MSDEEDYEDVLAEIMPTAVKETPKAPVLDTEEDGDLADFMASMNLQQEDAVDPNLLKPWMRFHKMELVQTPGRVKEVIDGAIAFGRCSLDLETTGLDNRIDYDNHGVPRTKAKVVGYCIGYDGAGYYIPIRHKFDPVMGEENPNVSPSQVDPEITRLVRASQPKLTPEGLEKDPLASPLIEAPGQVKILFWHAKFDQEMLYPVTGLDFWHPDSFEDGMLMFYCLYSDDMSYELKVKAKQFLRVKDPESGDELPYDMIKYGDMFPKGTPKDQRRIQKLYPRPDNVVTKYGCSDAICTELLCTMPWLVERLEKVNKGIYRLEKMTVQAVRIMERSRVLIDKRAVQAVRDEAEEALKETADQIEKIAESVGFKNFNPGSSEQLADLLFEKKWLNLEPKPDKTGEGQYKTDSKTLEKLMERPGAPAILKLSLNYRQIQKVLGTYLDKMVANVDEHDQLRFDFKQHGAATGRFSAPQEQKEERAFGREGYSGIPIQGIPARDNPKKPKVAGSLRKVFIAHPGYCIVKVDYAGQELRIVTNLSGEPVWKKEFLEGTGDLHTLTAQAFYPGLQKSDPDFKMKRNSGKMANFSLIYGGGVQAIMRATGCDKTEAARKLGNFHDSVPKFAKWVKKQHASVKRNLGVRTAFGRFIAIPDANVKIGDVKVDFWGNPILRDGQEQRLTEKDARIKWSASERVSTNYPIQGCLDLRSLVNTRNGWTFIGELVGANQPFTVWTGSRWAEATAHDMGPCELAEIKLKDGTIVRCDTRHKLLVVSDAGYQWVEYQDLEPGMAVATALCEPVEYEPASLPPLIQREAADRVPQIDDLGEFWYWMGRYMGDGVIDTRGGIRFCFGSHEREAIDSCKAFWERCGLNANESSSTHTPCHKESTRFVVDVWSVNLFDWLRKLGFEPATAHTKRCPRRIFGETLAHRRAFLRGVMASDGHKPPLVSAKGNPYNVHLCQRPLLEDLKLLFRSVGVESVLRGPYRSGEDREGDDTISYRLDLNRRMYERNVEGRTGVRHPKFCDMFAPQFLVDELLKAGPWARAAFPDESSYNLYLRLKVGGRVTVYTLQRLCRLLGIELSLPIYGFKRLVEKQALGREEHTYTLSVQDKLHRFEADGVITKNSGADICKISLVKCVKEFTKRGWLKNGGDDSVRMLMTVHDEIVFEIRLDRLMDAMPVISELMESPDKMTRPPWEVPLIVEPLVDTSWDANVNWVWLMDGVDDKGKPHVAPDWLAPHLDLDRMRKDEAARLERKGLPPAKAVPPPPTSQTSLPLPSTPAPVNKPPAPVNGAAKPVNGAGSTPASALPPPGSIATFTLDGKFMTPDSVWMVAEAQLESHPVRVAAKEGRPVEKVARTNLRMVTLNGDLLIDPAFNADGRFDIDPETFSRKMRQRNLPHNFRIDPK